MRLVNLYGPDDFRLEEVPEPSAGDNDVVVSVKACGICGSDLGYVAAGGLIGPGEEPMPLGHELSGVVEHVGSRVDGIAVGDEVVVNPMAVEPAIGNGGTEGGFADKLLVRNAVAGTSVFQKPQGLSHELAALIEPLSVASHAVNQADLSAGEKVAVIGAGPIGLSVIAVLRYRGFENIVVSDFSAKRRALALEMGAAHAFDPREAPFGETLMAHHGQSSIMGFPTAGTDVFIEATGVAQAVNDALNNAKTGARIIVAGVHKEAMTLDLRNVLLREAVIKGSMAYPTEFPEAIAMLESGKVDVSPMITHEFSLSGFGEAFDIARNGQLCGKVMIRMSDG